MCKMREMEPGTPEYRFFPERRWRFDRAWVGHRIAMEIEGGVWSRGRHVRGKGFLADMEKYNRAALMGWRVFRFTPDQVLDGTAIDFMWRAIKL